MKRHKYILLLLLVALGLIAQSQTSTSSQIQSDLDATGVAAVGQWGSYSVAAKPATYKVTARKVTAYEAATDSDWAATASIRTSKGVSQPDATGTTVQRITVTSNTTTTASVSYLTTQTPRPVTPGTLNLNYLLDPGTSGEVLAGAAVTNSTITVWDGSRTKFIANVIGNSSPPPITWQIVSGPGGLYHLTLVKNATGTWDWVPDATAAPSALTDAYAKFYAIGTGTTVLKVSAGTLSATITFNVITPPALGIPSAINAVANTSNQVTLSWGSASNADRYYIERVQSGGPRMRITTLVNPSTLSFVDTQPLAGTTYTYYVAAGDGIGRISSYLSKAVTTPGTQASLSAFSVMPLAENYLGDGRASQPGVDVTPISGGRSLFTLTTYTTSGVIRYTLDGSVPSFSSPIYAANAPVIAANTATLKAFTSPPSGSPYGTSYVRILPLK